MIGNSINDNLQMAVCETDYDVPNRFPALKNF
jgi:hypothetical protein